MEQKTGVSLGAAPVPDRVEPFCQGQVDRRTAGIPGVLAPRHTETLFVMLDFDDGPHSSGKGAEVC
jgi:hypothetical protein